MGLAVTTDGRPYSEVGVITDGRAVQALAVGWLMAGGGDILEAEIVDALDLLENDVENGSCNEEDGVVGV